MKRDKRGHNNRKHVRTYVDKGNWKMKWRATHADMQTRTNNENNSNYESEKLQIIYYWAMRRKAWTYYTAIARDQQKKAYEYDVLPMQLRSES